MSKEQEIYVLNKRLRLRQAPEGFRTCIDSVLLAAACPAKEGESILDLGCGVGSAGLCVLERVAGTKLTGIDIQETEIELAVENAALNAMKERCTFIQSCVSAFKDKPNNHVICNPPYMEGGTHTPSPKSAKAKAHGHGQTNLKDWIDAALRNLKSKGSLTMIHRADELDDIMLAIDKRLGGIEVIPLWPRQGEPAKRVIVRGYRDRRAGTILHPGLVLHKENDDYTPEAQNILRDGGCIL